MADELQAQSIPEDELEQMARSARGAYVLDAILRDNKEVPRWADLPEEYRQRWRNVATAVLKAASRIIIAAREQEELERGQVNGLQQ